MPTGCLSSGTAGQKVGYWKIKTTGGERGYQMRIIRLLALLPFVAMLIGPFFVNRVEPTVLGMPFLLAWCVAWIMLSAVIMVIIFRFDPANRDDLS